MKKIISFMLTVSVILSCACGFAANAQEAYYDENMVSVDGVFDYIYKYVELGEIGYETHVAQSSAPTVITCKKDLKVFSVAPIYEDVNGIFCEGVSLKIDGDTALGANGYYAAKAGSTVTIYENGHYSVWAEDYSGNFTEVRIDVQDFVAVSTNSRVLVNGVDTKFDAYNIRDNNYFKLRDIAYALSGTSSQVEVIWNEAEQRVEMQTGKSYTAVGGEMTLGDNTNKNASAGADNVYIDGVPKAVKAYLINGNNYFKLRDLGDIIGFAVDWDEAANSVIINSK